MCILFFTLNSSENWTKKYKFILASNRDEFYKRPTQTLCHWEDHEDIIGSHDLKKGRGQGTWLGLNTKTGHLAAITNYRVPFAEKEKVKNRLPRSRGLLAADFLIEEDSPEAFADGFVKEGDEYAKTSMLLGDLTAKPNLVCCTNAEDDIPPTTKILPNSGVHGLTNKTIDYPWQKLESGKKEFATAIENSTDHDDLVSRLFDVISDRTTYNPDPTVEDLDWTPEWKVPHSAVFVQDPVNGAGTRTQAVILIENDGQGVYYEKSLVEPIDPNHLVWEEKSIKFKLPS